MSFIRQASGLIGAALSIAGMKTLASISFSKSRIGVGWSKSAKASRRTTQALKVRARAIQELSWIGATEALTRILNTLGDAALEDALPALIPETIPEALRARWSRLTAAS